MSETASPGSGTGAAKESAQPAPAGGKVEPDPTAKRVPPAGHYGFKMFFGARVAFQSKLYRKQGKGERGHFPDSRVGEGVCVAVLSCCLVLGIYLTFVCLWF